MQTGDQRSQGSKHQPSDWPPELEPTTDKLLSINGSGCWWWWDNVVGDIFLAHTGFKKVQPITLEMDLTNRLVNI